MRHGTIATWRWREDCTVATKPSDTDHRRGARAFSALHWLAERSSAGRKVEGRVGALGSPLLMGRPRAALAGKGIGASRHVSGATYRQGRKAIFSTKKFLWEYIQTIDNLGWHCTLDELAPWMSSCCCLTGAATRCHRQIAAVVATENFGGEAEQPSGSSGAWN